MNFRHFIGHNRWWLLAAFLILLAAGSRSSSLQPYEAVAIALSVPVVLLGIGAMSLRHASRSVAIAGFFTAALALVGSELELEHTLFPSAPVGTLVLSTASRDATLELPADLARWEVETHGSLAKASGPSEGHFAIDLERDGNHQLVEGDFQRSGAVRARSRRRLPVAAASHGIDTQRQELELRGHGPVHAHLEALSGAVANHLEVAFRKPLVASGAIQIGLLALVVCAVGIQAWAARAGRPSSYAAFVGLPVALALYLPRHYAPDDALSAVAGAVLVAALLGGAGAWLFARAVQRLAPR